MKIGFIGLGIMGKPMARNLLKAGHELVVIDVIQANVDLIVEAGAKAAASSKEVAEQCSLIITMVPNGPQVKEVVMGPGGVLEGAKAGTTVIDMSSIAPQVSQEVCAACAEKGVRRVNSSMNRYIATFFMLLKERNSAQKQKTARGCACATSYRFWSRQMTSFPTLRGNGFIRPSLPLCGTI